MPSKPSLNALARFKGFRAGPCRRGGALALVAAVASLLAVLPASAETVIVVNHGSHPSAEAAAGAEAQVNWTDGDPADDTVCTECFAATELQHYLRRISGREGDFAIVTDAAPPAGDGLLVGGPASNAATRQLAARRR